MLRLLVPGGGSALRSTLVHLLGFLWNLRNWHGNGLLHCVALHTFLWDVLHSGFHNFRGLCLNLRAGNVGGLLNDVMGNSFLRNELDHMLSFLPNLWNWHTNSLPQCVVLRLLLWNVLHNFKGFLHHFRHRDFNDLLNDVLLDSLLQHRRTWYLFLHHERDVHHSIKEFNLSHFHSVLHPLY